MGEGGDFFFKYFKLFLTNTPVEVRINADLGDDGKTTHEGEGKFVYIPNLNVLSVTTFYVRDHHEKCFPNPSDSHALQSNPGLCYHVRRSYFR